MLFTSCACILYITQISKMGYACDISLDHATKSTAK